MKTLKFIVLLSVFFFTSCSEDEEYIDDYSLTIEATPEEGGTVSPPSGEYKDGDIISLEATASTNYIFVEWNGDISSTDNPYMLTIESSQNINAVFKRHYEKGYYITNEGPFQNGTGSLTFVGEDDVVDQKVFNTVNNEDLGNIVNSMTLAGDNAYIIVNNSNKIIVADRYTMEKITTIEGEDVNNPRYIITHGNTAYVSNWGDPLSSSDDFIAIIDLNSNTVTSTISVGEGPENMVIENDNLFVALEGGWNQNNQVVIIDTNTNSITNTVTVGDVPNTINKDGLGNVWVLCGGNPGWTGNETAGSLYKINAGNFDNTEFEFGLTDHPEHLTSEAGVLYYNLNGKIYGMSSSSTELPNESMNGFDGFYYNLKAYNGDLYALDAKDYASEGELKVFNLGTGTLLETIETGIIPGDIAFQ